MDLWNSLLTSSAETKAETSLSVTYSGCLGDRYTDLGAKNIFPVFFLELYFNEKCVEVAINDFTMLRISSKWLRIMQTKKKNSETKSSMRKRQTVNESVSLI